MTLDSKEINKSNIIFILYAFFISFFLPILNFNDLYIIKFLEYHLLMDEDGTIGYVLKIDKESILKAYIYVLTNILIILILYYYFLKKFTPSINITINNKKNFLTNIFLFLSSIFFIYLKFNNSGNENLHHIFIQMLFFHSLISLTFFFNHSDRTYLKIYYLFILLFIILYEIFITNQIFMLYLFLTSSAYFFFISKVKLKKLFIYILVITIILFSINFFKIFLKRNFDLSVDFELRCKFVKMEEIHLCGRYQYNSFQFKNEIVPVPPSTFKIIYKYPKSIIEYHTYSAINQGLERLLKMNYLASDISSLKYKPMGNFQNKFLKGESYKLLKTKFIPRFIYPDKPSEEWGQKYAKEFHYLPKYDDTTSINLNSINESYINFGFYGAPIYPISVFIVLLIIFCSLRFAHSEFKILILLSIPIFIINSMEDNVSGWFGGIISYLIIILLINFLINNRVTKKLLSF